MSRQVFVSLSLILCLTGISLSPAQAALILGQARIDGPGGANDEFIDIINTGSTAISLTTISLRKQHLDTHGACPTTDSIVTSGTKNKFPASLAAGETLRVAHPSYTGTPPANLTYATSTTLVNNTTLLLLDGTTLLDSRVIGLPCPTLPPPPPSPPPIPTPSATSIRLNEILPNPSGDENTDEFIELYNYGDTSVDLQNWTLHDASASGAYTFKQETLVKPKSFSVISRATFGFALNNTGESLSLIDPSGKTLDHVSLGDADEDISYNFSSDGWHWSRFLTPGAANHLETPAPSSTPDIPDEAYAGVSTDFSTGSEAATSVVWDFGDGHKSYKSDTTHTYKKTGTYTLTLTYKNGSDPVTRTATIRVETYPHPKVRITALVPNPAGRDTDTEYLEITNHSKKIVRLKGWKIVTRGPKAKTSVHHPIITDIRIKPGKTKIITRTDSRFSLHNTRMTLSLQTPDGHTLQKFSYHREKSAAENERYARVPDKSASKKKSHQKTAMHWQWITSPIHTPPSSLTPPPAPEILPPPPPIGSASVAPIVHISLVWNTLTLQTLDTATFPLPLTPPVTRIDTWDIPVPLEKASDILHDWLMQTSQ